MTWVRTEDTMPLHPKLLRLSDGAYRLWSNALHFANRAVTDGKIDKVLIPTLNHHGRWTPRQLSGFVSELVQALWIDAGDHYEIHDYAVHQYEATSERVERKREVDREKQRRKRQRDDEKQRESLGMSPGDKLGDALRGSPSVSSVPARPGPISPSERERDARAPDAPDPSKPRSRFEASFANDDAERYAVADRFSAARKAAGGGAWQRPATRYGKAWDALGTLAAALRDETDPAEVFAGAMRGFLADAKAREAGYQITWLAQDFGAYIAKGATAAESKPVDLDRQRRIVDLARQSNALREQGQRAFEEHGDRAERSRLVAESERLAQECERLKRQA